MGISRKYFSVDSDLCIIKRNIPFNISLAIWREYLRECEFFFVRNQQNFRI